MSRTDPAPFPAVLIVEDDPTIGQHLQLGLQGHGYPTTGRSVLAGSAAGVWLHGEGSFSLHAAAAEVWLRAFPNPPERAHESQASTPEPTPARGRRTYWVT
jgi:hypothetical protein